MKFKNIQINQLIVNPNNDRHGPQGDEQAAIDWLFETLGPKMIRLAEDIAFQGEVFDPPLVKEIDGSFVVFDGNRRVACVKALSGICSVPSSYASKISSIAASNAWPKPERLPCQIETDQRVIEDIVSRRHNGTDGGRGQLRWDTRAKAHHANRIGATNQYPIAEAVEDFLHASGFPRARQIGRSTLFRLVNAKKRQERLGIYLNENGVLGLTRPKQDVLEALSRIADDIVEKRLTLKNVLNSEGVNQYMSSLGEDGLLKGENEPKKDNGTTSPKTNGTQGKTATKPRKRDFLIPKAEFEILWQPGQHKIELVWQELQFNLRFSRNPIAIAIVFRSLIELATDWAISKAKVNTNNKLAARVRSVAQHLVDAGEMEAKAFRDLERHLGDSKSPRELEALNRAIHSKTFMPSNEDLMALWAAFEDYIVKALKI
ncbi:hypothetical protein HW561_11795 [Rhodobacteraceae bacterium B1Z28]|uniref:ParB/Sulfiredoxin domain-containing protein n=1 Tax=Ruegeria haliotis TaxID=2747601 RepID=A0ABX2PQQ7_9RHOB|nr:hypothetical protein [Ruegeria haliotis]NVO56469.1 hypothetical protein [Ruegeria haliotis]